MKRISILLLMLCLLFTVTSCKHKHDYTKEETIDPTCTTDGYTVYKCECGDSYEGDKVSALGHSFGEWTTVVEPTEESKGLKERVCSCGEKETLELEKLEHSHKYESTVVKPTCEKGGYTLHTCACGDSYQDSETSATGHSYTEKVVKPTCEKGGYTLHTCACGDSYQDSETSAAGHSYTEKVVKPTCEEDGYTLHTCVCGDSYQDNETPAIGHTYGDWTVTKEPTETLEGVKERTCACGDVDTEVVPKIQQVDVTYDLNNGVFTGGYETLEAVAADFLADYNEYSGTTATLSNFLKDSSASVKKALSKSEMLSKWKWLFVHMYNDLTQYNTENKNMSDAYVSDTLDLLALMKEGDTTVINDSSKGPNFRTLVRSYLHSIMNESKGDNLNNPTFAAYCPDFSLSSVQNNLLASQFDLTTSIKSGQNLAVPERQYYIFKGWLDPNGDVVTTATVTGTYTAQWEEIVPVSEITISNKVGEINLFDTYLLTWTIGPEDAVNKNVKFSSSDTSIAEIDKTGLITTHKVGTVTFTILSLSSSGKTDTMTVRVVTPGYFDISYETTSYVVIDESIKLNASYIDSKEQVQNVTWSSLNTEVATVDANGNVTAINAGEVRIRAKVESLTDVYQDFVVTVIDNETYEALKFVLDAHESNVHVEYGLPIGSGTPAYYADIVGSVSKLLFNDELVIDTKYNAATNEKYGTDLESRRMESIEFVTVHYTGNMNSGANAAANASYFAKPLSDTSTSIHYCTGNDGVFKGLDEAYRAAHAGDDGSTSTVAKFEYRDTPVEVLSTDPLFPVVSITSNATFAINGRDTGVKVPEETKYGRGYVTDSKWLNDMGLAVNIKDGKYQIGTAWWCYTQVGEGRICSNGGNRNSIGIESCVNNGSDLWYTWQKTAQLVADIMYRHNLDITKVKGHHFFSAKDCPQPFLENQLKLWWEFIELVQTEYEKITTYKDATISFTSSSEYLENTGRVKEQPLDSQIVTYSVSLTLNGKTTTVNLASMIEGLYNK